MKYLITVFLLIGAGLVHSTELTVPVKKKLYQNSFLYTKWMNFPVRTLATLSNYKATLEFEKEQKNGTGFYHLSKDQQRWWLIDPQGKRYVSRAVNSVRPLNSKPGHQSFWQVWHFSLFNKQTWVESVQHLWQQSAFNGFGAWSAIAPLQQDMPSWNEYNYSINLSFLGGYSKQLRRDDAVLPVFDKEFRRFCKQTMRQFRRHHADPRLLGYFTDNEIKFWAINPEDYLAINDVNDPNYQAAVNWLKSHKLFSVSLNDHQRAMFKSFVLETYLKIVTEVIREQDKNHLIMGPRLFNHEKNNPLFMHVLGRYVDIVAINYYDKWRPTTDEMKKWTEWSGRPFLISEFYVKAKEGGLANKAGAGWLVETQRQRGLFYQNFVLALLQSGNCIGWHWYRYRDSDADKGANKGIVNEDFQVYQAFIDLVRPINQQVYTLADYFDNQNR